MNFFLHPEDTVHWAKRQVATWFHLTHKQQMLMTLTAESGSFNQWRRSRGTPANLPSGNQPTAKNNDRAPVCGPLGAHSVYTRCDMIGNAVDKSYLYQINNLHGLNPTCSMYFYIRK